jgi:sugar/nucleoside kinase (ribokinase family)
VLVDAHPLARITSARVSDTNPDQPPPGAPTLCLGDAVVELICESSVAVVSDGDAFVPHLGGSVATVAVTAARHGAHVALAGGAGDDPWGRWLRDRLRREGVGTAWFELVPRARTPVAIVALNREGEPSGCVYGESITGGLGDRLQRAALALLKAGSRLVVIVLDRFDGAIMRGELRLDVDGVPASVVSSIGAGAVLTGVLLARLATSAFYPAAVAESARACGRWGALE